MGFLDSIPDYNKSDKNKKSEGFLSSVPDFDPMQQIKKYDPVFDDMLKNLKERKPKQTISPAPMSTNEPSALSKALTRFNAGLLEESTFGGVTRKLKNESPEFQEQFKEQIQDSLGYTLGQGTAMILPTTWGLKAINKAGKLGTPIVRSIPKIGQKITEKLGGKLFGKAIGKGVELGTKEAIVESGLSGLRSIGKGENFEEAVKRQKDFVPLAGLGGGIFGGVSQWRNPSRQLKQLNKSLSNMPLADDVAQQYTRQSAPIQQVDDGYKRLSDDLLAPNRNISPNRINDILPPTVSRQANIIPETVNYQAIKTVDQLPTTKEGLEQYIKQADEAKNQGLELNLQLFAEAQERLRKTRGFASNSIMNADAIPQVIKDDIAINMPTYEPITNKETWDSAVERVTNNIDEAIDDWKAMGNLKTAEDTALGQAIMVDAIKKGDVKLANEMAYELSEKLTEAGQTVQAASILKRLTPEGMLTYVNRSLKRVEKELGETFKGNIKLTENEAKEIFNRMTVIRDMPEGRARDKEFAQIQKIISEKIPPTLREKLKALQRVNLLFNPKTMIRNVAGNVIMTGVKNTKDFVRSGLDVGINKTFKTGRTVANPSIKAQARGFKRGVANTLDDYKSGIDTSNISTQFELNQYRTTSPFKSKIFRKADELTRAGLKFGDSPFYQSAYDDVIQQQLKVRGLTEATPEIKALAEKTAKEVTFQDTNKFTEFFDEFRNALNKANIKGFGLGDVVLPFTKTPANILKTGIEYSPLNVINVVEDAVKFAKNKNSINQYKLVDNLAKTLTGTGLLGAGIYLAQKGLIEGKSPTDYDVASFKREQGLIPYSIKTGNKHIAFDWAQPASIPIAMGADIYNSYKSQPDLLQAISEGTKGGIGTLLSQSMVQGLQRLFSSYDRDGAGLMKNLENAGYNAVLQLMPFVSLSRQAAEAFDDKNRYTADDTNIKSKLTNQAKRNIPFIRNTLPEKMKTTGEPQKSRNLFDIFLNPANVGIPYMTPAKNEILRLYNESGEKIQFPRIAEKKITPTKEGRKTFKEIVLNGNQRSELQKKIGELTLREFEQKILTSEYKNKTDAKKAKELQNIITEQNKKAKDTIIEKYDLKQTK